MNLNDKEWRPFPLDSLEKDGIFNIFSTSSGIDKNKLENLEGNIPYITRTDKNNGIENFIGKQLNSKWNIDKGNVITIGLDTQTVFYQPNYFYTGQNIQILSNDNLNYYTAMFIIPLLKILLKKFSWGGNGATLTRLKKSKIMLPINDNGTPDYIFMETYTKEKEKNMLKKYVEYIKVQDKFDMNSISRIVSWKEFKISDIFNEISRGKRLKKDNHIVGNIPYVSSTMLNNGVDGFIGNSNGRSFNNCITIANSGSVGYSFYHPYNFIGSDHVTALKNKSYDKYIYLYISTMLKTLNKEKVLLPINPKTNEIDFEYMEQHMKKVMINQIKKYLNYVENRIYG